MSHTPTPWETGADDPTIRQASIVFGGDGIGIANCEYSLRLLGETEDNAAFIVEACNAHERLKSERDVSKAALDILSEKVKVLRGAHAEIVGLLSHMMHTDLSEKVLGISKDALALCEEGGKG